MQASCTSGIGHRIEQAVTAAYRDWNYSTTRREALQTSLLWRRLLPGAAALLLLSAVWSGLSLAALVLPRQQALAAQLQQTAQSSEQDRQAASGQLADLWHR